MVNRKCPIFWPPYYVPKDHSKGTINYLRFMGSQRVGHDWSDLAVAACNSMVLY